MNQIKQTTNYARFETCELNRPTSERHVSQLVAKIRARNLLVDNPILVRAKSNGKLQVLDGQHRLRAASTLGVPIFYREAEMMHEGDVMGGQFSKKWSPNDFLHVGIDSGSQHYSYLHDFQGRHGLPLCICASLLSGGTSFNKLSDDFRSGKFEVTDREHAEKVGLLVAVFGVYGVTFATDRSFVLALSNIARASELDLKRLEAKLRNRSYAFEKRSNWLQYVEIIDAVYNFKVRANEIHPIREHVRKWVAMNKPEEK